MKRFIIMCAAIAALLITWAAAGTVVYDTSIWSEFGFIVQRYIGSTVVTAIPILAIIVGIMLIPRIINWVIDIFK